MNKDNKTKLLNFRMTVNELRALEIMAMREGCSLSEMMRSALREAAKQRGIYAIGLVSILGDSEVMNEVEHAGRAG